MLKTLSSLLFLISLSSCSHYEKINKDHVVAGHCEEEFNRTSISKGETIWQEITQASGTGVSYLVTGLAYSTDFIVSFSGGVIGGIAICSPLIAIDIAASANGDGGGVNAATGECIGEVGMGIAETLDLDLGPKVAKYTKQWQCPSLDHIAKGLMKVADCYSSSGQKDLAKQQLEKMNSSEVFKKCLSEKLKEKILANYDSLEKIK